MRLVFPWLAVVFAAVIAIVAIFEIDMRSEEKQTMAEPTSMPSPTNLETPETMGPTQPPTIPAQQEATTAPQATEVPSTATPEPTVEPTLAPTQAPPSPTAPSAPAETPEPMPRTGGGAIGAGLALFGIASTLGLALRRSY